MKEKKKKLPDREKVVKGLEQCYKATSEACKSCPYFKIDECYDVILAEALEILKEEGEKS